VNSLTEKPEAAKRFVHWISTGKGAEIWWRLGSGDFPAQQSILDLFATDPQFDEAPMSYLRTAAQEAAVNPVPRPVTVGYLEYEQILQTTFQDIRNGANVQEALNNAVDRIESEMAKYR
jgi:multiple sugar transport system substrate-binding protein